MTLLDDEWATWSNEAIAQSGAADKTQRMADKVAREAPELATKDTSACYLGHKCFVPRMSTGHPEDSPESGLVPPRDMRQRDEDCFEHPSSI